MIDAGAPTAPPTDAARTTQQHRLAWVALAGLVVALHLPTLDNAFDNDDAWNYVLQAELALDGFQSAFQPVCRGPARPTPTAPSDCEPSANYLAWQNLHRLLPDASWIPRYAAFDLWMPGWHAPSVLLHALATVLLGLVAQRLLARVGIHRFDAAWVGAALFGLSPLHAQPVAWIGGTYDLMLGCAALATLLAFDAGRYWQAGLWAAVACMCKEHGILVAPLLALHWLVFSEGPLRARLRTGLRAVGPALLAVVVVAGLRRVQLTLATVAFDPQLTRSVGVDAMGLFHDAPLAALAGLTAPLRTATDLPIPLAVGAVATLLLAGLAVGQGWRGRARLAVFLVLAAIAFVLPVALLREFGRPLGLERIVFNERYLYVSSLFAAILAGAALLHRATPLRRALAAACLAGTLATGALAVSNAVRPSSPVPTLLEALRPLRGPALGGSTTDLYLLTNLYREDAFRLVMSRWLGHVTGVRMHWVQRGVWRTLERDPARSDSLDFMDAYVRVARPGYDPTALPPGAEVRLFSNATPGDAHAVTTPAIRRPGRRDAAQPESVPLDVQYTPGPLAFTNETLPGGALRFGIGRVPDLPRGWLHRASAWFTAPIDRERVLGVRITYTATGRPQPVGLFHAFEFGYLELHWTSREQPADLTYVQLPLKFDAQQHTETLWLDIDPVWQASGLVGALGIHPLDRPGEITIHAVDLLAIPKRRGPLSGG